MKQRIKNWILHFLGLDTWILKTDEAILTLEMDVTNLDLIAEKQADRLHPIVKYCVIDNAVEPTFAHPTDTGCDIFANEDITIMPSCRRTISTGVRFELPQGVNCTVEPKSGLASKGIVAIHGEIDEAYRGIVGVTIYNFTNNPYTFKQGEKVAQLVFHNTIHPYLKMVESVGVNTERGENGFGSTGK